MNKPVLPGTNKSKNRRKLELVQYYVHPKAVLYIEQNEYNTKT